MTLDEYVNSQIKMLKQFKQSRSKTEDITDYKYDMNFTEWQRDYHGWLDYELNRVQENWMVKL